MLAQMNVCDVCGRPPDGDSPDFLFAMTCRHDICNECLKGRDKCPKCNEGITHLSLTLEEINRDKGTPAVGSSDQK